jgi:transposase
VEVPDIMRALDPEVVDALWTAVEPLLPRQDRSHPLGCHRPRASDRLCFRGLLIRLVTGASWVDIEAILDHQVSDTTSRARRDEWIAAGIFERLRDEATAAFDRIIGLDLDNVAIDGSLHKAPYGGEATGPNPTDRGKCGWKWSVAADGHGLPIGWAIDSANRNDLHLLHPISWPRPGSGDGAQRSSPGGGGSTSPKPTSARRQASSTVVPTQT